MKPEIHKDWLERAEDHAGWDRFIKGEWLRDKIGKFWSGCFFGCMTQSENNTLELAAEQMDSPLWLVQLAEAIFEGLPDEESTTFPVDYMRAIPDTLSEADYRSIRHRIGAKRMQRMYKLVEQIDTEESYNQECLSAINEFLKLHEKEEPDYSEEWEKASEAARVKGSEEAWVEAYIQERDALFDVFKQIKIERGKGK